MCPVYSPGRHLFRSRLGALLPPNLPGKAKGRRCYGTIPSESITVTGDESYDMTRFLPSTAFEVQERWIPWN